MNQAVVTIWLVLVPVFFVIYRRITHRRLYSDLFILGMAVAWPLIELIFLLAEIGELWDDY